MAKNLRTVAMANFGPGSGSLQGVLETSLTAAGFQLEGEPEIVNYNQVYAAVRSEKDDRIIGSAWSIDLHPSQKSLALVGNTENYLKDRGARMLSEASEELINRLEESVDANPEWRSTCVENDRNAKRVLGRGSIIKLRRPIELESGYNVSELVIVDGQKGSAYTPDGHAIFFPRAIREHSDVVVTREHGVRMPVAINMSTIQDSMKRRIATSLALQDAGMRSNEAMGYYPASVKSSVIRDDSKCAIMCVGDRVIGTTAGVDCMGIAANYMQKHNLEHGYENQPVMRSKIGPDIRLSPEQLPALDRTATSSTAPSR